jgi:hypothetical protein
MHRPALLLTLFCMLGAASASAQKYGTAGGVRIEPDRLGFTVQQRVLKNTTGEGIAMGNAREVSGHLLAQQHFPLLGQRLNVYFGAGVHYGNHKERGVYLGPDLITGIEYKVNAMPLLLSFDFKPAIHLAYADWLTPSTGFSLRYVFIKPKKPEGFFNRLFRKDE